MADVLRSAQPHRGALAPDAAAAVPGHSGPAPSDPDLAAAFEKASHELAEATAAFGQLQRKLDAVSAERDEAVDVAQQLEALNQRQRGSTRKEDIAELARLRKVEHDLRAEIYSLKRSSRTASAAQAPSPAADQPAAAAAAAIGTPGSENVVSGSPSSGP